MVYNSDHALHATRHATYIYGSAQAMSPPLVLSCQQVKISQVIYAPTKVLRSLPFSLCFNSLTMSGFIPKILIFGHSFVRRLNDDLYSGFDKRARINFHMASSGDVSLKGIGGRFHCGCVSGRRSQYTWFVKPGHGVSCQSRQVVAVHVFVCGVGG